MEDIKELLTIEVAKVKLKAKNLNDLVESEEQKLDDQNKETQELKNSLNTTVNEVAQVKSQLWQLETNRMDLIEKLQQTREGCYSIGQDIEDLCSTFKECQELCNKITDVLSSTSNISKSDQMTEFEKQLVEKYTTEERKIVELENHYKGEIEIKEKQIRDMEEDEKKLDLDELKLKNSQEKYRKILCEAADQIASLEEEKLRLETHEKCITEEFENIEEENRELLKQISNYELELETLNEKRATLFHEMLAEKEEEQKLKASIENCLIKINTLQATEKINELRSKRILESVVCFGFKYDEQLTKEELFEQCKTFLTNEIHSLEAHQTEFENFNSTYEEKIREILEQKAEILRQEEETHLRIEKLRSQRNNEENEYNRINVELTHETEKQKKEIENLKCQLNAKSQALLILNNEIKEMEDAYKKKQEEISGKHKELDDAIERTGVDKKNLIVKLSEVTEQLKKLEKECDDKTYNIVRLENKKAQLVTPEKDVIARLKHKPRKLGKTDVSGMHKTFTFSELLRLQRHNNKKMKLDSNSKK